MVMSIAVATVFIFALSAAGVLLFSDLTPGSSLLIAFALSFSSTVFAVKVLEDKGEMKSLHGRVAIGILIFQDIVAVAFITFSTGKIPSVWALGLFGLILLRPILFRIMDRSGHGELVPLFGLFAGLVLGAGIFDAVGMKADLGALLLGVLLAKHPRAGEISTSLLNLKDIFLVGFFLNIGLSSGLSLDAALAALLFVVLLPIKTALFFVILTRFNLRARSATLATLSLSTYSEFGLIVGAIGVANGWIGADWLAVIALALAVSFVAGSPLNAMSHKVYDGLSRWLTPWEQDERHPDDRPMDVGAARIAVFGMGRVGTGAYDEMRKIHGDVVIGVDSDPDIIALHHGAGRNVILGDATDSDFWERVKRDGQVQMIMLTLPSLDANLEVIARLRQGGFPGRIAAVARFADEIETLEAAGAHMALDTYSQAGAGFAGHVQARFDGALGPLS